MKKLKKEEIDRINQEGSRAGQVSPNRELLQVINALKVGEALIFDKSEWKGKSFPARIIHSLCSPFKKKSWRYSPAGKKWMGLKYKTKKTDSGWMVERIK